MKRVSPVSGDQARPPSRHEVPTGRRRVADEYRQDCPRLLPLRADDDRRHMIIEKTARVRQRIQIRPVSVRARSTGHYRAPRTAHRRSTCAGQSARYPLRQFVSDHPSPWTSYSCINIAPRASRRSL